MPQEVVESIPKSVIPVYWDYYHFKEQDYSDMIENHKQLSDKTWFAGGAWCWSGMIPYNRYTLETMIPALNACKKHGIKNVVMTLWGDDGAECSHYACLPALFYLAQYAKGVTDGDVIKEKFKRLVGIDFDDFMLIDSPNYIAGNETDAASPCNPSKYMLYSDPFNGFLDFTVSEGGNERYAEMAERLRAVARKSRRYGYLFRRC